jgi:hypothetical protein
MGIPMSPELQAEDGWIDVCGGSPSYLNLSKLVKQYFPQDSENLANFRRRSRDGIDELALREDNSRGYVFVGASIPVNRGFDAKMQELRDEYAARVAIKISFTDFEKRISGFSWKKTPAEEN